MGKITIGVPIFNEILFLESLILNLNAIKNEFGEQVQVVFVDNCSTDGSKKYLEEIRDRSEIKSARYIFNTENQGFNFSCDVLINSSQTDYLWIIGAQDQIYIDGMTNIINLIDSLNPQLIICNARMRDEASGQIINESLWGELKSSNFYSVEDFFRVMGGPCQAVSCNIFRSVDTKFALDSLIISHYWGYFERICDLIKDNHKDLVITYTDKPSIEILIESDVVSASGISLFGRVPRRDYGPFYTSLELAEIANEKFKSNREIRSHFTIFRDPFSIPRGFAIARVRGLTFRLIPFIRLFRAYKSSRSFWVLGLPILLSPKPASLLLVKGKPLIHLMRSLFKIREF